MNADDQSNPVQMVDVHYQETIKTIQKEVLDLTGEEHPIVPVTAETELMIGELNDRIVPIEQSVQSPDEKRFWDHVKQLFNKV